MKTTIEKINVTAIFNDSPYFSDFKDDNVLFLIGQKNRFREQLVKDGVVLLNDILCACGLEPVELGNRLGWHKDISEDIEFWTNYNLQGKLVLEFCVVDFHTMLYPNGEETSLD